MITLLLVVSQAIFTFASDALQFPHFRHVDKTAQPAPSKLPTNLILLADDDFAPFSFKNIDGKLAGISVQLAMAACEELKTQCQIKTIPYTGLAAALQSKQGDVIIGGPSADSKTQSSLSATRPYFYSYSEFIGRNGANFAGTDQKSLAGRRLGFVKSTAQEAFLKKYYDRSSLVPFSNEDQLFEALRTGGLDLAFADSLRASFWLKGNTSRGCCSAFGAAFADKTTFTHGLVMLTRAEDDGLREAFDAALDRLQQNGTSSKTFATYLPASPF